MPSAKSDAGLSVAAHALTHEKSEPGAAGPAPAFCEGNGAEPQPG